MKIDLHVHSKHSKRPSEWILKQLGCPESFTEPMYLYNAAKEKGMGLVTITDHNTVDGCLEIGHLEGVFISEEVTTYFPEDRCKLHVLVYDINEAIHKDIQGIRDNVYELCSYLRDHSIVHSLAHPLYSVNRKLTVEHFEKAVLLFDVFEINGARSEIQNLCLQEILRNLTPEVTDRLADKHGMAPYSERPWEKGLTGGSDDHGSIALARQYTSVQDAYDLKSFLDGVRNYEARVKGQAATPQTLARTIYAVGYQFYDKKFGLEKHARNEKAIRLLDGFLRADRSGASMNWSRLSVLWSVSMNFRSNQGANGDILRLFREEAHRLMSEDPTLSDVVMNGGGQCDLDQKWFRFVNDASNKILCRFMSHIVESLAGANILNIFDSLGSAGSLYFLMAPYFVAFSSFSEERIFGRSAQSRFRSEYSLPIADPEDVRVAHFTDTIHEVNGVAHSLKRQIAAAKRLGKRYSVVSCRPGNGVNGDGIKHFEPIGVYDLPVYPEQKLYYPPFLEVLDYCYKEDFTHIHAATPGPLGLAAIAVARLLKLPLVGTYHTALPQYARFLTDDPDMEDLMWKYVVWFYDQMDCVFAPSRAIADELAERGINPQRIKVFPRGVDSELFHPSKRNGVLDSRIGQDQKTRLVYVGRVSKEKNLHMLVNAFKTLSDSSKDVCLVVVGDGPYREEMENALKGSPCLFTGYLEGETLAAVYASCDLFVFPSATDTFGNVVLEAQASGIPVVVTDLGGPRENMIPGETGVVIRGNDEGELLASLQQLTGDTDRLRSMGHAARKYAETRAFDRAFTKAWDLYSEVRGHSVFDLRAFN